jgi:hypothetical protein
MKIRMLAATALVTLAAPAAGALAADHTQQLDIGAELVRQQQGGRPWIVNLSLGATLGMSDGSVPAPVTDMVFRFTHGARVHPEAFATCTAAILQEHGPIGCPARSRIGTGRANANALMTDLPADVTVFNGPKAGAERKLLIYARALQSVVILLEGTLTKTSGTYGYKLDVPVGRIRTVGDNDAAITAFEVTVGGTGRGGVPFIEAPTSCVNPGWPFAGAFTYADGTRGASSATIACELKATNN